MSGMIKWKEYAPGEGPSVLSAFIMILITLFVHLFQIPIIFNLKNQRKALQCMFAIMTFTMSIGHHIVSEVGLSKCFLEDYEFAKLEIIAAIIVLVTLTSHLQNFQNPDRENQLNYTVLILIFLALETEYLDIRYQFFTILLSFIYIYYFKYKEVKTVQQRQQFMQNLGISAFLGSFYLLQQILSVDSYLIIHLILNVGYSLVVLNLWQNAKKTKLLWVLNKYTLE